MLACNVGYQPEQSPNACMTRMPIESEDQAHPPQTADRARVMVEGKFLWLREPEWPIPSSERAGPHGLVVWGWPGVLLSQVQAWERHVRTRGKGCHTEPHPNIWTCSWATLGCMDYVHVLFGMVLHDIQVHASVILSNWCTFQCTHLAYPDVYHR